MATKKPKTEKPPKLSAKLVGYLDEREVNTLRGKALVGATTKEEVLSLFDHIDKLEEMLEETNARDFFGTEGWRRHAR